VSRIKELDPIMKTLPQSKRLNASEELVKRYEKLTGIEKRIERLDQTVASIERQIRELTREAQLAVAQYEFRRFEEILRRAERLQGRNTHLCKLISRTEEQLIHASQEAAKAAAEVNDE
jgi:uncharacterized membrane protein YccC